MLNAFWYLLFLIRPTLLSSWLRHLNKAVSLHSYMKYNWQRANPELAACVEGRQVG